MTVDTVCRICGNNARNTTHLAHEMMFGYRDPFEYFECSQCGCLQICEIPRNLDKYYPDNYYAFSSPAIIKSNHITRYLLNQRTRYYLDGRSTVGSVAIRRYGKPNLPAWVAASGIHVDSKILDVGCGTGHLLVSLKNEGFSDLSGIDPFIPQDICYENGVKILKGELEEIQGPFDFIMLHHSFEHMADPVKTLTTLHRKTRLNGMVMIRMPIVQSYAWRVYRTNWIQLDAPRHLCLQSIKSMELLCDRARFKVEAIEFDSDSFQFWGSEQYLEDIPLYDPRSYIFGLKDSIFSESDVKSFEKKAVELNESGEGDQACFYLRRV